MWLLFKGGVYSKKYSIHITIMPITCAEFVVAKGTIEWHTAYAQDKMTHLLVFHWGCHLLL